MMERKDDFSEYYSELLDGRYDCVDRIVLNAYFSVGQHGGGFRSWWRLLHGTDDNLDRNHLIRMAARFARRCWAWANQNDVPIFKCEDQKKHEIAHKYIPDDPNFVGVFLILVSRAPARVFRVRRFGENGIDVWAPKRWPYVNHYSFHIMDPEWGHITIKMSSHPPFGAQIILNGHEWAERQARKERIEFAKEGNCFTYSSDIAALDRVADTLNAEHSIGRLSEVCDRWIYTACLPFGLRSEEQKRSGFRYQYSAYQLEYSRNLLFTRGRVMEQVFQGLIDRTRQRLDLRAIKTIFGRKRRPHHRKDSKGKQPRLEITVERPTYDLTVFNIHFGPMTLKIYTKGDCVLRTEVMVHNVKALGCGKQLETLPKIISQLQDILIRFLNVLHCAHINFLDEGALDRLPEPTQVGSTRVAGVNLNNPRMRNVVEALLPLALKPRGFTVSDLAQRVREIKGCSDAEYSNRQAAYDLKKIRCKAFVQRIRESRRYTIPRKGFETLAGALILRDKVIKPVLAGLARPRQGRRPKRPGTIDYHYERLQKEMLQTLNELGIVA
jgi:hypothetical protein